MRIFLSLLILSVALPAAAGRIEGRITLESKGRKNVGDPTQAIVFFRPEAPLETTIPATNSATITMQGKMFAPNVLSVNVGTEVTFPNADRIIHNAFSTTRQNEFDLGFYSQGESRTWKFDNPGLVKVFCNVHQGMVGHIMVMDTPYHVQPDENGRFVLDGVQPGVGKLFVWHPRGRTYSQNIDVLQNESSHVEASVKLGKRKVPRHKNKFGKPYKRSRDY